MIGTELIGKGLRIEGSRRHFLGGAGKATLSATAVALLAGRPALAAMSSGDTSADLGILNTALGLEYGAIAAYQIGAESGLLKKPVLDLAVEFQGHHKQHAEVLAATVKKLGGTPVEAKKPADYDYPVSSLKNQTDVVRFAAGLEHGAVLAYLGAVPAFNDRDLSKAAASILGDEAMHWAVLRYALGENPVPSAFMS